ncbi:MULTISPECIES: serine/threonine-protein kinase [unclassified Streptomyces]|uniref:serine/threonine-protein kinase n=1 Tax=unclassified Streptomyces TaxID=2593676 RepID=UPI00093EF345|nr:serine/threonine-protein kinase [Streptomyces sp. CB02400]OKK11088.1 serine/threonine protein kinase [Streptomyces sp. CB02400]
MRPLEADEPTVVGPYRLLGRLGSGGMGRVYLGRSAGGRTVAVKIVHPHFALDEEFRARFRREVDAARRVGGAWTAPVLDADPGARVPWVATAYAAGPSLAAAVTDTGPLPAPTVRALGAGLAEALTAVHALGLVHRDVKPSNVLLTLDGPLLIDFGIARATDGTASLTSTGVSIGSPGYMSPEQILGKGVTGAADVFSLGAVLAYAATGSPPFPGDSSAALLYKVVHEPPELGELDGELRELVEACLDKTPSARPTPAELAHRLAPEGGAARLVTAGWLPGALVEQVSRAAVRLLNLEATGEGPSGPVGFSRPSVGEGAAGDGVGGASAGGAPSAGGFGDPSAGGSASAEGLGGAAAGGAPSGDGLGGAAAGGSPSVGGFGGASVAGGFGDPSAGGSASVGGLGGLSAGGSPSAGSVSGAFGPPPVMPVTQGPGTAAVPEPRDAPPHAPATPHPPTQPVDRDGRGGPGKLSVSMAATSSAQPDGRGRRVSCTVALAVAGALAAVTVGSVFVLDLLPGGSEGGAAQSDGGGKSEEPASPTTVPAAYLGTWEGQANSRESIAIPLGTFRVTLEQAKVGEQVGTLRHTDIFGGVCDDVLTLKQVTKKQLVTVSVGAKSNRDVCNQAEHTVRLTPVGDDLVYESDSKESGSPKARLSKIE